MIWVVSTNTNTCHIYHYNKNPLGLTLIKTMTHPESRRKPGEFLTSDKPGRYKTDSAVHGAYSPHTDPQEVEIDTFSREIAHELDQGRKTRAYEKLIIISAPHMNGRLFQQLDPHVIDLVINNLKKDLQHMNQHDLLDFLQKNTQFCDT